MADNAGVLYAPVLAGLTILVVGVLLSFLPDRLRSEAFWWMLTMISIVGICGLILSLLTSGSLPAPAGH